tara:strand:- start:6342 stop:6674 length:333 start_codon:yes stop_codon:yes gene_type:complete
MARKFSPKDKDEVLDYSIDWSRLLGSDTISSVVFKVASDTIEEDQSPPIAVVAGGTVYGLQLEQFSNTSNIVTARFGAGTNNVTYKITCQVVTASGLTFARTIFLPIKEK